MQFIEAMLWISLTVVVYAYCGYPVLVSGASRLFGRWPTPPSNDETDLPTVALLIAALNEEKVIGERIRNALEQTYPQDKLTILIASDGSTDRTAEIVRYYAALYPGQVELLDFPQRRGKAAVLNEVISILNCDIVVFSDANTCFDPHAITCLTRWLCRNDVAVVCGKLILIDATTGQNVDGMYWRFENFLKRCEGRLGCLLGANGGIYAMRRADYVPIPHDTMIDDFVIPMSAKLKSGREIVYDVEAIAYEDTPPHMSDEFGRRCRIGAGGFQCMVRLWPLISPRMGWTAVAFVSHKVLRWLCPAFLIMAVLCNLALVERPYYRLTLLMQSCFYLAAGVGAFTTGRDILSKLLRLATMFTSMNLALLLGSWRWLWGEQRGTWQRTAR
jgi:cellulose synthase/poly-beta-1,6-N-acetylglucosamine synthase-like glycosyltransferase